MPLKWESYQNKNKVKIGIGIIIIIYWGQSWRSGTKCDCKTDWLWVRSPLEEMKYLLKFIFPFLRSGIEAKVWVLSLNTQCLQNSAESGKTECLTLGSFCLPCCVRDTAWSWFIYLFIFMFLPNPNSRTPFLFKHKSTASV